jgi:ribosomal protein S1
VVGQKVTAKVLYITDRGAATSVEGGVANGLIGMLEIDMYQKANGVDVRVGDELEGHVSRYLENRYLINIDYKFNIYKFTFLITYNFIFN